MAYIWVSRPCWITRTFPLNEKPFVLQKNLKVIIAIMAMMTFYMLATVYSSL